VALAHLVEVCLCNSIAVIDCQLPSAHLASLGSRTIPRRQFQALLREHISLQPAPLHSPQEPV
jgi:leucyl/phenylalanyl-tRNA---protein transferase